MNKVFKKFFVFSIIVTAILVIAAPSFAAENPAITSDSSANENGTTIQTDLIKQGGLVVAVANFLAKIVSLIGSLIDFAIKIGTDVLKLRVVSVGAEIVSNFVNMGFVLALIFMSFATILSLSGYGWKQTLWKIIVAAILVNFSLVIANIFIDSSNILTGFFHRSLKANFADAIVAVMNPQAGLKTKASPDSIAKEEEINKQKLASSTEIINQEYDAAVKAAKEKGDDPAALQKAKEDRDAALKAVEEQYGETGFFSGISTTIKQSLSKIVDYLVSAIFAIMFLVITVIVLLVIFAMLMVRAVILALLLIVMPAIWLAFIFQGTKGGFWKQWWSTFFRWTYFAPIMLFFLYLVARTSIDAKSANPIDDGIKSAATGLTTSTAAQGFSQSTEILSNTYVADFAQTIIMAALLIGGLITANKSGVIGAGAAVNFASKAGNFTANVATKGAAKTYQGARNRALGIRTIPGKEGEPPTGLAQRTLQRASEITSKASFIPGAKGLSNTFARAASGIKTQMSKDAEDYQKNNASKLSDNALMNQANSVGVLSNPVQAAGLAAELAKRGLTGKKDESGKPIIAQASLNQMIKAANTTGYKDDLVKARPDLAGRLGKKAEGVVRPMRPDEALKIEPVAFADPKVVAAIGQDVGKISRMMTKANRKQRGAIQQALAVATAQLASDPSVLEPEEKSHFQRAINFNLSNPHAQTERSGAAVEELEERVKDLESKK